MSRISSWGIGLMVHEQEHDVSERGRGHDQNIAGWIFDVKRFAVHDGPGVRSTVFLKGCPLRCWWCHNPEAISGRPQLAWDQAQCIGCGACVEACPNGVHAAGANGQHILLRDRCQVCGECVEQCYPGALAIEGRQVSVAEVMPTLLADREFYLRSGGGVTLSGGEPLAQPRFAEALLATCKSAGLHTALDTCGQVGWEVFEQVVPAVDLVLYDLKHMDTSRHREYTGQGNEQILANLRRLSERGVAIEVRMPIIPTANDDEASIAAAGRFLAGLPQRPAVRLLPYHRLADGKYRRLGLDRPIMVEPPDASRMQAIADRLRSLGLPLAG